MLWKSGILWREEVQKVKDEEYPEYRIEPYACRQLCNAIIKKPKTI